MMSVWCIDCSCTSLNLDSLVILPSFLGVVIFRLLLLTVFLILLCWLRMPGTKHHGMLLAYAHSGRQPADTPSCCSAIALVK